MEFSLDGLVEKFREPIFLFYFLDWLFCIIVFSCITQARGKAKQCPFQGQDDSVCNHSVLVGVLGFLFSSAFMVLEFEQVWNRLSERMVKAVYTFQLGFSALFTLLFFLIFCSLVNKWRVVDEGDPHSTAGYGNARAAIAFSFFGTASWALTTYLLFKAFKANNAHEEIHASYTDMSASDYQDPVTGTTRNPMLNLDSSIAQGVPTSDSFDEENDTNTGIYVPPTVPSMHDTDITSV